VSSSNAQDQDASRTRQRIVYLLKTAGPSTAAQLGTRLDMTTMGVRRHLAQLEREGLARHEIEQKSRGRPTHRYRLTESGDGLFPRRYENLAQGLVDLIVELDGEAKLRKLLHLRTARQLEAYRARLEGQDLAQRVESLARLRDEEGFMGRSEPRPDGTFLLIENNCALCDIARCCPAVCDSELELFRGVLPEADVQRIQHLREGDTLCVYRIERRANGQ
jgi:iron-sulfur cluster biosynthesis transcriptional regulator SufR